MFLSFVPDPFFFLFVSKLNSALYLDWSRLSLVSFFPLLMLPFYASRMKIELKIYSYLFDWTFFFLIVNAKNTINLSTLI